nr:mannose-1-phosphate guanylyltransferase 1 [Quercus suber]
MLNFLKDFETKLGIKITCSQETEPLGTASPLALARDKLLDDSGEPFFVLNSDVISEYPLKEMIAFHKSHGGEASIMVTKSTGKVESFVEICCREQALCYGATRVLDGHWTTEGLHYRAETVPRLIEKNSPSKLSNGPHIVGNVIVDETAKIGEGCLIGPDVAIGPGCIVESGVRLSRCTVMQGVRIKKHACISSSMFVLFLSVSLLCKSQCLQI